MPAADRWRLYQIAHEDEAASCDALAGRVLERTLPVRLILDSNRAI